MTTLLDWDGLSHEADSLHSDREATAVGLASRGAQLLHRALSEMYIGEPEPLREIAFSIADARPEVVAIRNVGVSAYRTAREARSGDRMAAAARSVARLGRLLGDTPTSLGASRGQPLLAGGCRSLTTHGRSESVRCGHRIWPETEYGSCGSIGTAAVNGAGGPETMDIEAALSGCDIVLLGCTAFLADGSMAADPGTLALVETAADRDPIVPVHFFADTLKLAPWLPESQGGHALPELDIIPPRYVDHVITEDGIRRPEQLLQAAADLGGWWQMLATPEG